jgi:hypothetical protein
VSDREEIAACVLSPHFDAVRDVFAAFEPEPGVKLSLLRHTRLVVTAAARNGERHYARCRDDGRLIELAPEAVDDLDHEQLVAMTAHEFGHAADFAYPGSWVLMDPRSRARYAVWLGDRDDRAGRRWRRIWHDRSDDEIEWSADAIATAVTGIDIGYCGPCMIQCFSGPPRPAGLG